MEVATRRRSDGSNPPSRTIVWGQQLGLPECPYLTRWVFQTRWFAIRLHHWHASDDQRHYHDHAWWFLIFMLKGRYIDRSPAGEDELRTGSVRFRPAAHRHTVEVDPGGAWTLLLSGPESRVWGFWVGDRFRHRNKYFYEYGHHPCDP